MSLATGRAGGSWSNKRHTPSRPASTTTTVVRLRARFAARPRVVSAPSAAVGGLPHGETYGVARRVVRDLVHQASHQEDSTSARRELALGQRGIRDPARVESAAGSAVMAGTGERDLPPYVTSCARSPARLPA